MRLLHQYRAATRKEKVRIKNQIIQLNVGLCNKAAREKTDDPLIQEELRQIGIVGLEKTIKRFDLSKEVAFSSYAMVLIRGEIQHWLRDNPDHLSGVRLPRRLTDARRLAEKTQQILAAKGRDLSLEQVARMCLISDWEEVKTATQPGLIQSADAKDYSQIAAPANQDEQKEAALQAIATLPQLQKEILLGHYISGKSITELARNYNTDPIGIKMIIDKTISELREATAC